MRNVTKDFPTQISQQVQVGHVNSTNYPIESCLLWWWFSVSCASYITTRLTKDNGLFVSSRNWMQCLFWEWVDWFINSNKCMCTAIHCNYESDIFTTFANFIHWTVCGSAVIKTHKTTGKMGCQHHLMFCAHESHVWLSVTGNWLKVYWQVRFVTCSE